MIPNIPALELFGAVAAGGALGAVLRTAAIRFARPEHRLPYATLAVNGIGSLLIGAALAAVGDPRWQAAVVGGFLGGFTTFSTFAVETARLFLGGKRARAATYVFITLTASAAAAAIGFALAELTLGL
ncbi:CrcB family protein [Paenibacillus sp. TRM 82003]|nr:CrcB family protein [Paenibacillus sp. TRM 82003]